MSAARPDHARHRMASSSPTSGGRDSGFRAASICPQGSPRSFGFALALLMLVGLLPTVPVRAGHAAAHGAPNSYERFDTDLDRNGNGLEDILDRWLAGESAWRDLRLVAGVRMAVEGADKSQAFERPFPGGIAPASGAWQEGRLRLLCLGGDAPRVAEERAAAAAMGHCEVVHSLQRFGGVTVLDIDEAGLREFLRRGPDVRIMLDRDGVPALATSRLQVGADALINGPWRLGDDWSSTVAILDSGCDTAHGDLGDFGDDDLDGPAPNVGDGGDWYPADDGWPLFEGYKVVGWHDVTDDFPQASGPWDYQYHGTALASVVAGSGLVDPQNHGMAPGSRLTVVKYYDFDEIWHAWAGDFLAACAWTLDHQDVYRISTVLAAVNWEVDAGISTAMAAFADAGIVPVVAMGNYGTTGTGPGFPASLSAVLSVGATNGSLALSAYSGRGIQVEGKPDLLAPGGGKLPAGGRILVADIEPNDTYSPRFGTSLSAAHVAGAMSLLDEALRENGVLLPRDRSSVQTRMALLKLTSALVDRAENEDGTGELALPAQEGHDTERGWGLLRIDAAVEAMVRPLLPGRDQRDTLLAGHLAPVAARRLVLAPGVRYLIEAVPSGSLDVSLEVCDPRWLDDDPRGGRVIRQDANGPGFSEFTYVSTPADRWLFLVVKRVSGQGTVNLKVREADSFASQGGSAVLPGLLTGAPSFGRFSEFPGPSLVIPSRVTVDLAARSLNLLTPDGAFQPGWPVFVFPHPSSQGGLTQPLVWDMDGNPGDEIVVSSEFGSVYFFAGDGSFTTVDLVLNRSLTPAVGFEAGGLWKAAVVDKLGWVRTYSHEGVELAATALGHSLPRAAAAGIFRSGGDEALVVSFSDGYVTVLDADLAPLPGWPRDLGVNLSGDPVLVDLDEDGFHEIVFPVLDGALGQLVMRVFSGDGQPGPGDGQVVSAPGGGSWLGMSGAVVAGGYASGDLHVAVNGIVDNGLMGDEAAWTLASGCLLASGAADSRTIAGLAIRASTTEGVLIADRTHLTTPVTWNYTGGAGTEVNSLVSLQWNEILYGLTSLPGSLTAWFGPTRGGRPLSGRQGLSMGGRADNGFTSAGTMLVPGDEGAHLRIDVLDRNVGIMPVVPRMSSSSTWGTARGDTRNSGAYPLKPQVSASPLTPLSPGKLAVFPNPGNGRFQFKIPGMVDASGVSLEIFDLRGRRVAALAGASGVPTIRWDGMDRNGRPVAAGSYLAVARSGSWQSVTRVVLTR